MSTLVAFLGLTLCAIGGYNLVQTNMVSLSTVGLIVLGLAVGLAGMSSKSR